MVRIFHDDDILNVFAKVNEAIKPVGIVFEDDGREHDGYCIFLVKELWAGALTQEAQQELEKMAALLKLKS